MRALDNTLFPPRPRRKVPHAFVLDAIASLSPETRPMFGCLAVYVKDRIVFILRDRHDALPDNGVWLATSEEHHRSLRREFPSMRSLQLFGTPLTHWQVLPADAPDFEEQVQRACDLVLAGDARIGKIPGARRPTRHTPAKAPKAKRAKAPRKRP